MNQGTRLRFVRKYLLRMSQTEMSEALDVKQQTYSRAENSEKFSQLMCEKINRCAIRRGNSAFYINLDFLQVGQLPAFRKAGQLMQLDHESLVSRAQQLELEANRLGFIADAIKSDKFNKIILEALVANQVPIEEKRRLVTIIQRIARHQLEEGSKHE